MQFIIQIIGLLALLLFSFLGANYLLSGDMILSGIISVVLSISSYYMVEFLKKRKTQLSKSSFKSSIMISWIVFIVICLPITYLIIHALNVELNAKSDIQAYSVDVENKNKNAIAYFITVNNRYIDETNIEATNLLDLFVNTKDTAQKDSIAIILSSVKYGINDLGSTDKTNLHNKANALKSAMEVKSQNLIDSINNRTNTVIESNLFLIENWSRLRVVGALSELENLFDENLKQMDAYLKRENSMNDIFLNWEENDKSDSLGILNVVQKETLTFNKSQIDIRSFSSVWGSYKAYWLIIPVLLFVFFLLLPYFLEKQAGVFLKSDDSDMDDRGIEI